MTIYSVYYTAIMAGDQPKGEIWDPYNDPTPATAKAKSLSFGKAIASLVKQPGKDQFVFITVRSQEAHWNKWIKDNGLEEHLTYQMKEHVTNGNHVSNGRNLWLRVLQQKESV